MQPVIGLSMDTSEREGKRDRFWLKQDYLDAVKRAGGLPLPLPPTDEKKSIEGYVEIIDGLVLTGGDFDIHPRHYGEKDQGKVRAILEGRTDFEMRLCEKAFEKGMPLLGVCGGMQLLNVCRGGTLIQHVENHERCEHPVAITENSLLKKLLGKSQAAVNSTHHQAVGRLGRDLMASAKASDGVVEAIEGSGEEYLLGVQWHPEALADSRQLGIYQGLVAAAIRYAEKRRGE